MTSSYKPRRKIKGDFKSMDQYPEGRQLLDRMPMARSEPVVLEKWVREAFYILRYEDYDDESITSFIRVFAHAMDWSHEQIAEAIDKALLMSKK